MPIQSKEDLNGHFKEQLEFLKLSAEAFDNGFEGEAKRLAVTLRVLLHDKNSSVSLLSQLGLKSVKFFDTSMRPKGKILGPYEGIVLKMFGSRSAKYVAPLDDYPPLPQELLEKGVGIYIDFLDWWTMPIIIDGQCNQFNRKELILDLANKDGGAHVDSHITEKYESLSRKNSMGWVSDKGIIGGPEKAAIRQITHEVLRSLLNNYPTQKKLNQQGTSMFSMAWVTPIKEVKEKNESDGKGVNYLFY